MWVRKNSDELASKKKYYKKYSYVIFFAIFFLLQFFLSKINGEWHRFQMGDSPGPLSWGEAIAHIPKYLAISAILAIGMYLLVKAIDRNDKTKRKKFVCDKCNTLSENNGICQCGGTFVDIELMKWVDDELNQK
jgi:hypothetical protein